VVSNGHPHVYFEGKKLRYDMAYDVIFINYNLLSTWWQ
jgi:hypothetical protein